VIATSDHELFFNNLLFNEDSYRMRKRKRMRTRRRGRRKRTRRRRETDNIQ
jgi:hypothetical protein